jgi:HEAT repeat protein
VARRFRTSSLIALAALALAPSLRAQATKRVVATARAGQGQPGLSVGFDSAGVLRAAVCAAPPCKLESGSAVPVPQDALLLAEHAVFSVMRIAKARRAITLEIDDPAHARSFVAVLAAPVDGSDRVKVVFSGFTGLIEGEFGERHGPMVQRGAENEDGSYGIVIGERREDLSICGRQTILSPKLVAADLTLKSAKVQRLTQAERAAAREVTAHAIPSDSPASGYRLLRAVGASSAVGNPASLTDGDPNTTWSENRGGEGRGEFVMMNAPSQLPITGLELVLHPPAKEPEHAVAPSDFWLATATDVVHVTMPPAAWKEPGARFEIPLGKPLAGDCLTLVTEGAQGGDRDARVTFAELTAKTEFDQTAVDGLVGALAGGGKRAEAAGEALRALGPSAVVAIAKAFDSLDEGGRRVALDVVDQSPCSDSVGLYVRALTGPYRAQRVHARARLRNCGDDAARVLVTALGKAPRRLRPLLVGELSLVAPAKSLEVAVWLFEEKDVTGRRLMRKALAWATRQPEARSTVLRLLADPRLGDVASIDLLRMLGDRAKQFQPAAGAALARIGSPRAGFRSRFLLLGPAAQLAGVDAGARRFVASALTHDPDAHVRAEAARRVAEPVAFRTELLAALRDPNVRVREAAVETLSEPSAAFASEQLAELLKNDRWPLVRKATATALGHYPADPQVDRALADALEDSSPLVRAPVLLALGERGATAHAEEVRDRLTDRDEAMEVRSSAALALGLMCDAGAVDILTDLAKNLGSASASTETRMLGPVAVAALGRIHPPDLQKRLGPLLEKSAWPSARAAASAALSARDVCGRRAGR